MKAEELACVAYIFSRVIRRQNKKKIEDIGYIDYSQFVQLKAYLIYFIMIYEIM